MIPARSQRRRCNWKAAASPSHPRHKSPSPLANLILFLPSSSKPHLLVSESAHCNSLALVPERLAFPATRSSLSPLPPSSPPVRPPFGSFPSPSPPSLIDSDSSRFHTSNAASLFFLPPICDQQPRRIPDPPVHSATVISRRLETSRLTSFPLTSSRLTSPRDPSARILKPARSPSLPKHTL
ncbi:uncharacterized protein N7482_008454 [Penicillium canariense]|uniref:Uncharacterized protein n=1 Tax=Penicillium canariense TaxID=189055 RepID=A0A9W9HYG2_9EURO|nr:uncharacterized protein N7482_008454 [Penicillium canariense]KAJ5157354.1 hypothetical protein N7482_008454 [Penicillium canariense]